MQLKSESDRMQVQFENKADIPSGEEASFVEFEQDGKQVYMHIDLAESKKETYRNKGQLSTLTDTFDKYKSGILAKQLEDETKALSLAEDLKKESLAKQAEALEKQKEELIKNGETEKLHELTLKTETDRNQLLSDSNTDLQKKLEGLKNSLVEKDNRSLSDKISNKFTTKKAADSLSKLLMMDYVDNKDGKSFFTSASGEVINMNNDGDMDKVLELINQDDNLNHFASFPDSKGGFGGKGGSDSGGGKTISRQDFESKTQHQQSALIKSGVIPTD